MSGKGYGMSDFGEGRWIKSRKQLRCEYCYGPIPKGEEYYRYKGLFEGEWQNWAMHRECHESYSFNDPYGEGFSSGDAEMPDRVKDLVRSNAA